MLAFALLVLTAAHASAQAHPFFRVFLPLDVDRRVNRGSVAFSLLGPSDIEAVRARVETLEVDLAGSVPEFGVTEWNGAISISSLPEGVHDVFLTVTYADGSQLVSSFGSINYDRPPRVTINAPTAGSAANPLVSVDVTCTDEPDGCRALAVSYRQAAFDRQAPIDPQRLIACDPTSIAGTFDLSRFAGTGGWLDFIAADRGTDQTLREEVTSVPIVVGGTPATCDDQLDAGGCATAAPAKPAVTAPLGGVVARPNLALEVSCASTPDAPCRGTYVWYQRNPYGCCELPPTVPHYRDLLACGLPSHEKTIDMGGFDGTEGWLLFTAHNEYGSSPPVSMTAAVELTPTLCDVAKVDGPILDADATRIFLLSPDQLVAQLFDRVTGQYRTVMRAPLVDPTLGPRALFLWAKLTPRGVVFAVISGQESFGPRVALWELDGVSLSMLSSSGSQFTAAGNYVAWVEGTMVMRRDIATDTTDAVGPIEDRSSYGLGSNGDVVFIDGEGQLSRFRGGASLRLTSDPAYHGSSPVTDGDDVVYVRTHTSGSTSLVAIGAGGERVLDDQNRGSVAYQTRLNSGQLVFTDGYSLFVGTPSGVTRELDVTGTIEGINSAGEVMVIRSPLFWYGSTARCLIRPNADPIDVSAAVGTALNVEGRWHIAVNGALFSPRIGADCGRDGGFAEPDAGAAELDGGTVEPSDGSTDGATADHELPGEVDAQAADAEAQELDGAIEEPPADAAEPSLDATHEDAGRRRHRDAHCAVSTPGLADATPLSGGTWLAALLFAAAARRPLIRHRARSQRTRG